MIIILFFFYGVRVYKKDFEWDEGATQDRGKVPNMGRKRGWESQEGFENWSRG